MKTIARISFVFSKLRTSFGLTVLLVLTSSLGLAADPPKTLDPQPAYEALNPGLSVHYYYGLFRHVDELIEWQDYRDGEEGKPISKLDYRVGLGDVLTSSVADGVGAKITGLIHFSEPGTYAFTVQSNDGVRLEIGGVLVLEDPDVHGDRFSNIAQMKVASPGWYPLNILYFERKNTSTLELYWQMPSEPDGPMDLVPANALAHL